MLAVLQASDTLDGEPHRATGIAVEALLEENHDLRQLCCGHDVTSIIAIGLKQAFGTIAMLEGASRDSVERGLRSAYSTADLVGTDLHSAICDWENEDESWLVVGCRSVD